MAGFAEALFREYRVNLHDYVAGQSEESLRVARELGRRAAASGLSLPGVAQMHHEAVAAILEENTERFRIGAAIRIIKDFHADFVDSFEKSRGNTEEEVLRLNRELIRRNAELEQMLYVASHDLRSPLVNVQGFARLLAATCAELTGLIRRAQLPEDDAHRIRALIDEGMPESLRFIQRSVAKMDALLSGLQRLSRLGHAALRIETLDVGGIVAEVVEDFAYVCRERGARIAIADALPACRGDAAQLNQVFSNLIDNALKYLDPSRPGRIFISGRIQGLEALYCVEDNGIGMKPEQCEKAFEIFHRLNPGDGLAGEGLGLTIVRHILARQNGKIRAEAAPGRGAKFFVALPVA